MGEGKHLQSTGIWTIISDKNGLQDKFKSFVVMELSSYF